MFYTVQRFRGESVVTYLCVVFISRFGELQVILFILIKLLAYSDVMGRRKQARPHRSGGVFENFKDNEGKSENFTSSESQLANNNEEVSNSSKPFFVEIDRGYWTSEEHLDIAEVVLTDLRFGEGFSSYSLTEEFWKDLKFSLRFLLQNVEEFGSRLRLGHWPVMSTNSISLEFVQTCRLEDEETESIILSGNFDGPDEGVSGLVHLVSQKILTLRPVPELGVSDNVLSLRVRVEVLKGAFDACESLWESTKQPWKKSMVSVMGWLRPEVTSQEARYSSSKSEIMEVDPHMETGNISSVLTKSARFDAAGFYEAIKQSK